MAMKGLRNLCTPSYVYLVISAIALVVMMYQNMGNVDKYCLGSYSCNVSSTALIFVIKAIYILFWTWVLNLICKAGAPGIAWFVLLLPFILLFVILGSMIFMSDVEAFRILKNEVGHVTSYDVLKDVAVFAVHWRQEQHA